ncbi:MAG TPA: dihydrofolate reductase family protein [Pseudonocardiaceae bacterium]
MRELASTGDEASLFSVLRWESTGVRLMMVMAVDGSVTDRSGWTSGLGGTADQEIIRTQRAMADAILVGAGSMRTGRYPPHRPSGEYALYRERHGLAQAAPLVVASRTADLDFTAPAFAGARVPTILLTDLEGARRVPMEAEVEVVIADGLSAGMTVLRTRYGLGRVLCEGGPGLASALFAESLVDEVHLTLAPRLEGADLRSLVRGLPAPVDLELRSVHEAGGNLLLRYIVRR